MHESDCQNKKDEHEAIKCKTNNVHLSLTYHVQKVYKSLGTFGPSAYTKFHCTQKKMEPKRCLRKAVLENGSFLQRGAIFL